MGCRARLIGVVARDRPWSAKIFTNTVEIVTRSVVVSSTTFVASVDGEVNSAASAIIISVPRRSTWTIMRVATHIGRRAVRLRAAPVMARIGRRVVRLRAVSVMASIGWRAVRLRAATASPVVTIIGAKKDKSACFDSENTFRRPPWRMLDLLAKLLTACIDAAADLVAMVVTVVIVIVSGGRRGAIARSVA